MKGKQLERNEGSLTGTVSITGKADSEIAESLSHHGLNLTVGEARRIAELLGRDPTIVELTIFNTMWSEHCSYKSSRKILRALLPTEAPNVVLGPGEEASYQVGIPHDDRIVSIKKTARWTVKEEN